MSPRFLLLAACALFAVSDLAYGEEACCEKPVSRTSMLTGKGAAAAAEPACDECESPVSAEPRRKLWPILSLSLGGAAAAVGALYVRRRK
jgi:hypothetical protein